MSKYISKFWITVTIILFTILYIILLPKILNRYGIWGAVYWSPLLIIAAVLAYIRGYWVSKWMSDKNKKSEPE